MGCLAAAALAAAACGGNAATTAPPHGTITRAPRTHAAMAAPAASAAPAAAPTGCGGTGPARRAWAEEVSAAGRVSWQVRLPTDPKTQGIGLRPLVIGGTAVFAEENAVYALSLRDGRQLWKRSFPLIGNGPLASASNMVYGLWQWRGSVIVLLGQVSDASRLLSLNGATGAVRWTLPLGKQGETGSQTLTGDGGLAMIRGFATLTVVDLTTGHVRWGRTAGNSLGPLAADGVVIAPAGGEPSGKLLGYSSRTGRLLWTRTGMPSEPEPTLASGLVVISRRDQVMALSPATGRTVWTVTFGTPGAAVASGPGGVVVTTSNPDVLYLIGPKTGRVRWHVPYQGWQMLLDTGTDLLYEGAVAGGKGLRLVDLRAASGSVRWTAPAPASSSGRVLRFGAYAVVVGDTASRLHQPGVLAAFRLTTGRLAWTASVPTFVQVPMVVAGADLLVQPTDASYGCVFLGGAGGPGTAAPGGAVTAPPGAARRHAETGQDDT